MIAILLNSTPHTFYEWEFSVHLNLVASAEDEILIVSYLIHLAMYILSTLFLFPMLHSVFTLQPTGC